MREANFLNLSDRELDAYIYRVISIERLLSLFKSEENILRNPSCWDDPFENFILKSKVRQLSGDIVEYNFHNDFYGQCWTLHKASDAMWRIYSPNTDGVRIRTTIRKLAYSLYSSESKLPDAKCYIGKVRYLTAKQMTSFANTVYEDGSVLVENLFHSLLVKRKAFKHEREVRLLYSDIQKHSTSDEYSYPIKPYELINQLMLDPRLSVSDADSVKKRIKSETGFAGSIKRSLLYSAPEEIILNVKKGL